jgi:uncharacterized membrane protein YdbT with pleckstrin-like domain
MGAVVRSGPEGPEQVLFRGHPGAGTMMAWGAVGVLVMAGALAVALLLPKGAPLWQAVALAVPVVVAFLVFVGKWLGWVLSQVVVTDRRVLLKRGLLRRATKEIPVDRIQSVQVVQGIMGRMLDVGTVSLEAGGEGSLATELIPSLAGVRAFKAALDEVLYGNRG